MCIRDSSRFEPGSMRLFTYRPRAFSEWRRWDTVDLNLDPWDFFFLHTNQNLFRMKKVGHSRFEPESMRLFFTYKPRAFSEWRRWDTVDLNLDPWDFLHHTDQGPFPNEEGRPRWGTADPDLAQSDFVHTNHGPLTWANLAHGQHCHRSWCNIRSWSKHDRKNNALLTFSPWQNWNN